MARLIIVEDNPELASLMASAATSRGHEVRTANTGQEALAAIQPGAFDAAVVDLMLPDLPGSEVLDALKGTSTPAIAMSGLAGGDGLIQEVTEIHGARAFFQKPFELLALLDAVESSAGLPSAQPAEPAPDDFQELATLAPVSEEEDPEEPDPLDLPFARREQVWSQEAEAAPSSSLPAWKEAGALQPGSVPRLLTAAYQTRHTGELKLSRGQVTKLIVFESGTPVYAASNLANERFARFCARRQLFPESELGAVAALAKEAKLRTGEAMVRLELITPTQRLELLVEQIKEILWSAFSWESGRFAFASRRPSRSDLVKLAVFPGNLILEGVNRTETLISLRRKLSAETKLFPTAEPPYAVAELELSDAQKLLLAQADGTKTVEDLIALTELSERDALATLHSLVLLGLLEERAVARTRRRISFGI